MTTIQTAELTNTQFNHNKAYSAHLQKNSTEWWILCRWGKIGGNLTSNKKGPYTTQEKAEKEFRALIAKKKADGYLEKDAKPVTNKGEVPLFYQMKANDEPDRVEALMIHPTWIAEQKFDGARYFLKKNDKGAMVLHSRKVSVITDLPVDKTENIPHIIEEAQLRSGLMEVKATALDGEIMWDHGALTSVMGAKAEKSLARQKELGYVYFVVYDLPYYDGEPLFDTPFWKRRLLLETLLGANGPFIRISKQVTKNKNEFLEDIWLRGGEGIVLKNPEGLYQPGDRPKDTWIKVKSVATDEFIVMGFEPGKGKYKGQVGSIIFGQHNAKGQLIPISFCSGFSDEERLAMTKKPKSYLGNVVEVKFNGRTTGDDLKRLKKLVKALNITLKSEIPFSLRHPRFLRWRDDKNAKECVFPSEYNG